jgi:hypothetical protein
VRPKGEADIILFFRPQSSSKELLYLAKLKTW